VNCNLEDEDKTQQAWKSGGFKLGEREKKKGFNGVSLWPTREEEEEEKKKKLVHTNGEV
jgi:hypothetical protein